MGVIGYQWGLVELTGVKGGGGHLGSVDIRTSEGLVEALKGQWVSVGLSRDQWKLLWASGESLGLSGTHFGSLGISTANWG